MSDVASIASSGLRYGADLLGAAASNIANLQSDGYQAIRVRGVSAEGGGVIAQYSRDTTPGWTELDDEGTAVERSNVSLEDELVSLREAVFMYGANASVIRAQDEAIGTLVNRPA